MYKIDERNLRFRDVIFLLSIPTGIITLILLPGYVKGLDSFYYLAVMGLIVFVLGINFVYTKKIQRGYHHPGGSGSGGGAAPLFLIIPLIVMYILRIFVSFKNIEGLAAQIIGIIFIISGLVMMGVGVWHFI